MCTSADVDRLRIIIPHFDSFSACIYLLRLTNDGIGQGLEGMNASLSQMETLQTDMNALQSAIPTAFAQAAETIWLRLTAKRRNWKARSSAR